MPVVNRGYFILHTKQTAGCVKGGNGRPEEWITIVRDDEHRGCYSTILESIPTQMPEGMARKRQEVQVEPRPSKRARI